MKKFFIFQMKGNSINKDVLLSTLDNLYHLEPKKLQEGFEIYNQICNPFDINNLKETFKIDTFKFYITNNTIVELNPSCIILKTENDPKKIFKDIEGLPQNLLACCFQDEKCFWI